MLLTNCKESYHELLRKFFPDSGPAFSRSSPGESLARSLGKAYTDILQESSPRRPESAGKKQI